MSDVNDLTRLDLRILATTDLHMNLFAEAEPPDAPLSAPGLARAATLIERCRQGAQNTLLFDNGDFLHGTALADYLAEIGSRQEVLDHPMITAMNRLRYDAVTLGNHDFAYGSAFLRKILRGAQFPVISSNLHMDRAAPIRSHLLMERQMTDRQGKSHPVRIGVIGVLPPQTTQWDRALQRVMRVSDMAEAVRTSSTALRAGGAALIVLLAHSGIAEADYHFGMENGATALAAGCDVDLVIAGHTHLVFPGPAFAALPGVDTAQGRLGGKPAVMAGFWGSHLGQIDLELAPCPNRGWRIAQAATGALPAAPHPPHNEIAAIARPNLARTRQHFDRKLAQSSTPLHSHFAHLGLDGGQKLIAMAQRWYAKSALRGTRWQGLPILATTNPSRAGGRSGPNHYADIPAGALHLRDLTTLYPYPNRVTALEVGMSDLSDWLERSASTYHQITPGLPGQPLIDPDFPSYNFDVIDGLTWQIDLSQPARYAANGRLSDPKAQRISQLARHGIPLGPHDRFVLVTNSYRHAANGLFSGATEGKRILLDAGKRNRDLLRRYVTLCRKLAPEPASGFRFAALPDCQPIFETTPRARAHLAEIAHFAPEDLGISSQGFLRLRLHL